MNGSSKLWSGFRELPFGVRQHTWSWTSSGSIRLEIVLYCMYFVWKYKNKSTA